MTDTIHHRGRKPSFSLRERVDHHHDAITEAVGSKKTEQLKKLLGDLIKNTE
jgi:hypothetical protein